MLTFRGEKTHVISVFFSSKNGVFTRFRKIILTSTFRLLINSGLFDPNNRITEVEVTVVLKLNQGTIPKTGCNRFRVAFFGSFLAKQKRTIKLARYNNASELAANNIALAHIGA